MKVICNKSMKYTACLDCDHSQEHTPYLEPGLTCTVWKGCSIDEDSICVTAEEDA